MRKIIMNEIVEIEHSEGKGLFYIKSDNKSVAEMTFVFAGSDRFIIDHTEISPANAGKGYGKMMVAKAVEYARGNGMKIIPLCPYAKSVFDKTPEYKDVL